MMKLVSATNRDSAIQQHRPQSRHLRYLAIDLVAVLLTGLYAAADTSKSRLRDSYQLFGQSVAPRICCRTKSVLQRKAWGLSVKPDRTSSWPLRAMGLLARSRCTRGNACS